MLAHLKSLPAHSSQDTAASTSCPLTTWYYIAMMHLFLWCSSYASADNFLPKYRPHQIYHALWVIYKLRNCGEFRMPLSWCNHNVCVDKEYDLFWGKYKRMKSPIYGRAGGRSLRRIICVECLWHLSLSHNCQPHLFQSVNFQQQEINNAFIISLLTLTITIEVMHILNSLDVLFRVDLSSLCY